MPGGGWGCEEGDVSDKHNAIPNTSRWQRAATKLERFYLRTSDVDGYEGDDGDDADADQEEPASQAIIDWRRMWRTEGIVLESVRIG